MNEIFRREFEKAGYDADVPHQKIAAKYREHEKPGIDRLWAKIMAQPPPGPLGVVRRAQIKKTKIEIRAVLGRQHRATQSSAMRGVVRLGGRMRKKGGKLIWERGVPIKNFNDETDKTETPERDERYDDSDETILVLHSRGNPLPAETYMVISVLASTDTIHEDLAATERLAVVDTLCNETQLTSEGLEEYLRQSLINRNTQSAWGKINNFFETEDGRRRARKIEDRIMEALRSLGHDLTIGQQTDAAESKRLAMFHRQDLAINHSSQHLHLPISQQAFVGPPLKPQTRDLGGPIDENS